jgi:hypothetical protein
MAKKKSSTKGCTCIDMVNEALREHNTVLTRNIMMGDKTLGMSPVIIKTDKLNSRGRAAGKTLYATFCPFCGKEYPEGVK